MDEEMAVIVKLTRIIKLSIMSFNPKKVFKELIKDPAFDSLDRDRLIADFEEMMNKPSNAKF